MSSTYCRVASGFERTLFVPGGAGKKPLILITSALVLFLIGPVWADMSPKPTMDFKFPQLAPGNPLTIVSGALLESGEPDCNDATPLEHVGPQSFHFTPTNCHALAYGFKPYHRLELQFADGRTRRSNVFKTAQFNSDYTVTIGADDLLVKSEIHLLKGASDELRLMLFRPEIALCPVAILVAIILLAWRKRPC